MTDHPRLHTGRPAATLAEALRRPDKVNEIHRVDPKFTG
jgi:hypothetical protein